MNFTDIDYPEEYRKGEVEFFGKKFKVTPDVLIPRLETEGLVRRARHLLRSGDFTHVVDIGSGSGIIGISVADLAEKVSFMDISESALSVAKENFLMYFPEEKGGFIQSDLLTNLTTSQTSNILFLANLPYVKAEDWVHMSPDTRYEPEIALFGGERTGFEIYERLFAQLGTLNFELSTLIIEFGFDQREIAEKVIQGYGWKYEFFADYAGIERFCEIELTNI